MGKKKLIDIEITELFLVKADWDRTYMAQIVREKTCDGKDIIRGSVVVNEGKIYAIGETEDELGTYLDEMCILKLDYNLHASTGVTIQIFGAEFFLN